MFQWFVKDFFKIITYMRYEDININICNHSFCPPTLISKEYSVFAWSTPECLCSAQDMQGEQALEGAQRIKLIHVQIKKITPKKRIIRSGK